MKDEQVEVLVDWFNEFESKYSINVKYIHCDNPGENKTLQQQLKKDGSKIQFEFTAPDMPQQNSVMHSYTNEMYKGYDKLCRI